MLIYPKGFAHVSQIRFLFPLPSCMTTMNPYFICTNMCQVALKRTIIWHLLCSGANWEGKTSQRQEEASWVVWHARRCYRGRGRRGPGDQSAARDIWDTGLGAAVLSSRRSQDPAEHQESGEGKLIVQRSLCAQRWLDSGLFGSFWSMTHYWTRLSATARLWCKFSQDVLVFICLLDME